MATESTQIDGTTKIPLSLAIRIMVGSAAACAAVVPVVWWAKGVDDKVADIPAIRTSVEAIGANQIRIMTKLEIEPLGGGGKAESPLGLAGTDQHRK